MVVKQFLILSFLFVSRVWTHDNCSYCKHQGSTNPHCYNDGHVYSNSCFARCKNPNAQKSFSCYQAGSITNCVKKCENESSTTSSNRWHKESSHTNTGYGNGNPNTGSGNGSSSSGYGSGSGSGSSGYGSGSGSGTYKDYMNCVMSCPSENPRDYICGSDRKAYTNRCRMKCTDRSLTVKSKCYSHNFSSCHSKCLYNQSSSSTSHNTSYKYGNYNSTSSYNYTHSRNYTDPYKASTSYTNPQCETKNWI